MSELNALEALEQNVAAIMAGWNPLPTLGGKFVQPNGPGFIVGGIWRRTPYVKLTWAADDSPDTPDDPIEAAHWLVRHVGPEEVVNEAFSRETDEGSSLELGAELLADAGEGVQVEGDVTPESTLSDQALAAGEESASGGAGGDISGLDAGATGDRLGSNGDGDPTRSGNHPGYSGLLILPDELGARRNAVLAAITARQLLLLDVAADPSRRDFLRTEFVRYQNAGALGLEIDATLQGNYAAYLALQATDARVNDTARQIARVALEADLDGLERIAQGLEDALR